MRIEVSAYDFLFFDGFPVFLFHVSFIASYFIAWLISFILFIYFIFQSLRYLYWILLCSFFFSLPHIVFQTFSTSFSPGVPCFVITFATSFQNDFLLRWKAIRYQEILFLRKKDKDGNINLRNPKIVSEIWVRNLECSRLI